MPKLRQLYRTRIDGQPYKKLLQVRQQLPVYHHRDAILEKVSRQNVVVIAGETGSGKSTQIPQFMLEVCVVAFSGRNVLRYTANTINLFYYRPQTKRSCGKVMFSQMSVYSPRGGGVIPCGYVGGAGYFQGGVCQGGWVYRGSVGGLDMGSEEGGYPHPPSLDIEHGIWLASGWYASYWNVFLFELFCRQCLTFLKCNLKLTCKRCFQDIFQRKSLLFII